MIIQCVSCGYSQFIDPNGSAEEIEQKVYETIEDGWRYTTNYDGYVCGKCKQDPLHEAFCGKIRKATKEKSYMRLVLDMAEFEREYRTNKKEVTENDRFSF